MLRLQFRICSHNAKIYRLKCSKAICGFGWMEISVSTSAMRTGGANDMRTGRCRGPAHFQLERVDSLQLQGDQVHHPGHNQVHHPDQNQVCHPDQNQIHHPGHNQVHHPDHNQVCQPDHNQVHHPSHKRNHCDNIESNPLHVVSWLLSVN